MKLAVSPPAQARVASPILLCPVCEGALAFDATGHRLCCAAPAASVVEDGIVRYRPALARERKPEMSARDAQAAGYLTHGKFPTQIYRLSSFIEGLERRTRSLPILDLGCGPGPTTQLLLAAGFEVVAIDISVQSLLINQARSGMRPKATFVHADLTEVRFAGESAGGLMMADFLQHLGNGETQREFLARAFAALAQGGWFFLSVFNVNLKNRIKNDVDGAYSGGAIPYHRFTRGEVLGLLPSAARVERIFPMNIFHSALPDRIAARFPLARHFARMMVFCGSKI